jgi:hypothetical protein
VGTVAVSSHGGTIRGQFFTTRGTSYALVLIAAAWSSYCASEGEQRAPATESVDAAPDERMEASTGGSATTGGSAGVSGSAGSAAAPDGTTSVEFGSCVYDCSHLAPDPLPGCGGAISLCRMLPLTSLECFCDADRGASCPATLAAALDRVRERCTTSSFGTNSRIYQCAGRSVTLVALSIGLSTADYLYDAAGNLIGAVGVSDCTCGPCGSLMWGAGDVDCTRVDECSPCPSDAGTTGGIPACSDAGP